jgi:hypothetical protein
VELVRIVVGALEFLARWEEARSPRTCAVLRARLPFEGKLLQARWSGEAAWVPLGELDLGVGLEDPTSYPAPGELLFHPAGISETEILFPYGPTRFASKAGQLAGSHVLTVVEGRERLAELGRLVVWEGAQPIRVEAAPAEDRGG